MGFIPLQRLPLPWQWTTTTCITANWANGILSTLQVHLFSSTRYGRSKRIGVNSSFAIGPAFYRDELEMLNDQVLIQGVALGTNLTLGLEYFFRSNISLGLESSLFSSQAQKVTVTTAHSSEEIKLEKENYENLSRLDLSLGIIWYW
jgi:hypothetical protein